MTVIIGLLIMSLGCIKAPSKSNVASETIYPHRVKSVDSFFDKQLIEDEIIRNQAFILGCYEKQITWRSQPSGRLLVDFVIDKEGLVYNAYAKVDTLGSQKVTDCVLGVFQEMQFPAGMTSDIIHSPVGLANENRGVKVSYPFVFSTE